MCWMFHRIQPPNRWYLLKDILLRWWKLFTLWLNQNIYFLCPEDFFQRNIWKYLQWVKWRLCLRGWSLSHLIPAKLETVTQNYRWQKVLKVKLWISTNMSPVLFSKIDLNIWIYYFMLLIFMAVLVFRAILLFHRLLIP